MELKRYQWVGLLAGVPLFSGAWLSAVYNTPWWGVLGFVLTMMGIYVANKVEKRSDNSTHAKRGLVAGVLAALVARLLGVVALAFGAKYDLVPFSSLADTFRVVLVGDLLATLLLALLLGAVGAAVAILEPEANRRNA